MTNKPMLSVERDSIALEALKAARQFIANGIELGFISMPETPDPAHDTLPMIDRAIAELKAAQHHGDPVVMPERMKDTQQDYSYVRFKEGYNAALETVARLNGVKP